MRVLYCLLSAPMALTLAMGQAAPAQSSTQQSQQTPSTGVYDQSEQVRRQAEEDRRYNEDAAANLRPNPYALKVSRIEGKVVMPDGGPPPEPVRVEMLGGSGPESSTFTDSKGRFSFTSGLNSRPGLPPTLGGATSGGILSAGRGLIAVLPGFKCEPVAPGHSVSGSDRPFYTLYLKTIVGVEGFTISMTSLTAPQDARKAYDKGRDLRLKQKPDQAEKELRKAVALHPDYAAAWYQLGNALLEQNRKAEAIEALQRSLQADPKYVNPYPVLAQIAYGEKRWDDLAASTGALIKLNPYFSPNTYLFSATANLNLSQLDIAETHAREAVKLDADHKLPKSNLILGLVLARRCQAGESAAQLNLYLTYAPAAADAASVKGLLSQLESPGYAQHCAASGAAQP